MPYIRNGKPEMCEISTTTNVPNRETWHINGTEILEKHPRFKGIRAAIDYLNVKQAKKKKRKPLDWHICIEMFDVGLTVILIALLISVIIFK